MNSFVIETDKLSENVKCIRDRAGDKKIYAVVKGNGYGMGLAQYAKVLRDCGISAFAVTEPEDVTALRTAGISEDILMLRSTALADEVESLLRDGAILTVGSTASAQTVSKIAGELGLCARVHIKIDTGMGRYGFNLNELSEIKKIYKTDNLAPCGIYTHLNAAFGSKRKTLEQIDSFLAAVEKLVLQGCDVGERHFAASVAFFRFSGKALGDAVRIGSAFTGRLVAPCDVKLNRIGYLESNICEIRDLPKGATVGYGGVYKAKSARRIAIVPLGYSHGVCVSKSRDSYRLRDLVRYVLQDVRKTLSRAGETAQINGKNARILGHVGMLHTVLDVTDIPCATGDTVRYGASPLHVDKGVARKYI